MTKRIDILKNVEFLDLVRIHVYKGQATREDPFPFRVEFECLDKNKRVVFDASEFTRMNLILTEKSQQFHPADPRLKGYIEEFCGRLASELYRNGLCELEEVPEGKEDPYALERRKYPTNR